MRTSLLGGIGLSGTVAAAYLGTLASSGAVIGGLFGALGATMTGAAMSKYAAEVRLNLEASSVQV